jgi:hypothetical protein
MKWKYFDVLLKLTNSGFGVFETIDAILEGAMTFNLTKLSIMAFSLTPNSIMTFCTVP